MTDNEQPKAADTKADNPDTTETPLDAATKSLLDSLGKEITANATKKTVAASEPMTDIATPHSDVPSAKESTKPEDAPAQSSTQAGAPKETSGSEGVSVTLPSSDSPSKQQDVPTAEAAKHTPSPSSPSPRVAPPPQRYRYRVVISPPAVIQTNINAAVEAVRLESKHLADGIQWQAEFQTTDIQAVLSLVKKWVNDHFPLKTSLAQVYAAVEGQRTYLAGWKLDPVENLQAAHRHLAASLGSIITVEPTANTVFHTNFLISRDVPADDFPRLVAFLQRDFKPLTWEITACKLIRQPIDNEGKPIANSTWETAETLNKE